MTASNQLPPRRITNFAASDRYRQAVHGAIVGGAHTYSKGDDQFPALAPGAIARGKGGRVWDLDGNEYVDCALGLGAVSLGHAYEPVLAAVRAELEKGAAFARPAAVELDLAHEILDLMPGMERVKFAKNGSNVTTAAVKLARAYTGRELVAFPGNHPFYSFDDWFIGSTVVRSGVPEPARRLSLTYDSRDPETLERLFAAHPREIACVITEPEDAIPNPPEVIARIGSIAKRNGAVFILDEMVTGFRAGLPGAYTELGLAPDLATWGKAIGNGFSFCVLAGKAAIMDLGGIRQTAAPRVFLLSTTHGGEAHVLAAARAVLAEYRSKPVIARHRALVAAVAEGMRKSIADHRLGAAIEMHVVPWRVLLVCRDRTGAVSAPLRTLLMQEMIGQGALFQGFFLPCFSHSDADVAVVLSAFDKACAVYAHAFDQGIGDLLIGDPARPVFRKYNACRISCPAEPCPHEAQCREAS
ncbi:MAG TPA: glutamate-1-semialdehyde 2,1-aminomutase [Stellaceae bacterium]|nr:glutamate-1-semialdehyde 2,1-aminomutase [Stellaceae bacterium]